MSNPITSLWHAATSAWDNEVRGFQRAWQDLFDVGTLFRFEPAVQNAFKAVAGLIQSDADMAAVTLSTVAEYGRETAYSHRNALIFLRETLVPRMASAAYHQAIAWALASDLKLDQVLTRRIAAEHAAMLRRVLEEEMGREVAIAQEHADMITRVAIEANTRALADLRLDSVLTARIAVAKRQVLAQLAAAVAALNQAIAQVRAYAQSIPGLVDQRAANGYDPTLKARSAGLSRLLDTAVAHQPLVAALVKDLAGWLVDLAEVDNPVLRLAAQLVLKQLIDRLGLDTALGALVNGILGGVLGGGPPKTLLTVEQSVGNRLNAAEGGLAALSPLAPEADALHEMGTLAFDAALLGYLAAAVADPVAAADDTVAALTPVTGPLLAPVRALLGMG